MLIGQDSDWRASFENNIFYKFKNKYLEIKFVKHVRNTYKENYKMLLREIKKQSKKYKLSLQIQKPSQQNPSRLF